jgi:DNA polymerase III alpha subunit (gram-positive type)
MSATAHRVHTPAAARDFLWVDCEVSALDPFTGEIIELAAVRTSHDMMTERGFVNRKTTLTHPELAEAKALEVNRYNVHEWASAVPIRVALVELSQLMAGGEEVILVGHNPVFDVGHIREAYRREKLAIPKWRYTLDTFSLAWPLVVKGYIDRANLESLCTKYRIDNDGSHRAMADVRRTMKVYRALLGLT